MARWNAVWSLCKAAVGKAVAEVERDTRAEAQCRDYTLLELRAFDGTDPRQPILLAAQGKVYDVTRGRNFYGPGGAYAVFAGKDCTRALALLSVEEADCTGDVAGLSEEAREKLEEWVAMFDGKYPVLGRLDE